MVNVHQRRNKLKIYTKTGDDGETGLYDGTRIAKDDIRVECYGTLDELNSALGICKNYITENECYSDIEIVQRHLFDLGAMLATIQKETLKVKFSKDDITWIENRIDYYSEKLPPFEAFILPGNSKASAFLHLARTIARRGERLIINLGKSEFVEEEVLLYMNRLSDLLFVFASLFEGEQKSVEF